MKNNVPENFKSLDKIVQLLGQFQNSDTLHSLNRRCTELQAGLVHGADIGLIDLSVIH